MSLVGSRRDYSASLVHQQGSISNGAAVAPGFETTSPSDRHKLQHSLQRRAKSCNEYRIHQSAHDSRPHPRNSRAVGRARNHELAHVGGPSLSRVHSRPRGRLQRPRLLPPGEGQMAAPRVQVGRGVLGGTVAVWLDGGDRKGRGGLVPYGIRGRRAAGSCIAACMPTWHADVALRRETQAVSHSFPLPSC